MNAETRAKLEAGWCPDPPQDPDRVKRPRGRPKGTTYGGRTRFMTRPELDRLFAEAKKSGTRDELMLRLAEFLALRVKETVELRTADFDLGKREVLIRGAKNGAHRYYPLPPEIWRLYGRWLKARPERAAANPYLFPSREFPETEPMSREGAKRVFLRNAERAGIRGMSFHSLRHSRAQSLAEAGDPQVRIAAYLRHKSVASSLRYVSAVSDANHAAEVVRRYGEGR